MPKTSIFTHQRRRKSRRLKFFHVIFHLRNVWRLLFFRLHSCSQQFRRRLVLWLFITHFVIKTSLMINFLLNHLRNFRGRVMMDRFDILWIVWFLCVFFIFFFWLWIFCWPFRHCCTFVEIELKFRLGLF